MEQGLATNSTTIDQRLADTLSDRVDVRTLILALVGATKKTAHIIRGGGEIDLGQVIGDTNADGDNQKALDVLADEIFCQACSDTGLVRSYYSEEQEDALPLNDSGDYLVAIDPLDGSSNIDTNVSIGTIFSIFPAAPEVQGQGGQRDIPFRSGRDQLAAGFFVYGPQTTLYLTTGSGTDLYRLNPDSEQFELVQAQLTIAESANEYAINASNARHWEDSIASYINDCLSGDEGYRGADFNMRWIGSLVADAGRIFSRGGVFLYPGDNRAKYTQGRLRLIYEAYPVAMLVEQAKGMAINGTDNILDLQPVAIHQRTPLIFGSSEEVRWISTYYDQDTHWDGHNPLFGHRSLFRKN
jgi:fructose-1,6-bisphosphatase I